MMCQKLKKVAFPYTKSLFFFSTPNTNAVNTLLHRWALH